MKKMMALSLLISCSLAWADPRHLDGGQDLGGGDLMDGEALSQKELETIVRHFEEHRVELFRSLQLTGLVSKRILATEPRLRGSLPAKERETLVIQAALYERIFANGSVDEALRGVRTELREDGPCYDRAGQERDGSIVARPPFRLCLSLSRLRSKLNRTNADIEVLALYLHEVSHLFGTTEEEATNLQALIRNLGPDFKSYFSFLENGSGSLRSSLMALRDEVAELSAEANEESLCKTLPRIAADLLEVFVANNVSSKKVVELSVDGTIEFHAAVVIAGYTKDFCEENFSPGKLLRETKFHNRSQAPIAQLYPDPLLWIPPFDPDQTLKLSQYLLADLAPRTIVATSKGNRKALAANLNELNAALAAALR